MRNRFLDNLDEFSFLPRHLKRKLHGRLLRRILAHAERHPLSRLRLDEMPNWGSLSDDEIWLAFDSIVPTDTVDHRKFFLDHRPEIEALLQSSGGEVVISSGGSESNQSKFTWWEFSEVERNAAFHGKGYRLAGINEDDCAVPIGLAGPLTSEYTGFLALRSTGCFFVPIGVMANTLDMLTLLASIRPSVLLVGPSDFADVARMAIEHKVDLTSVRLIITGSEACQDSHRALFAEAIGNSTLQFGSVFQTSDVGTIGYQCKYCRPNEYHVHEELQILQSEDTFDGIGDLVVTNLDRYLMPVVKLRTGDLIKIEEDAVCECGRTDRKFVFCGRRKDRVRIGSRVVGFNELLLRADADILPSHLTQFVISQDQRGLDLITVELAAEKSELTVDEVVGAVVSYQPVLRELVDRGAIAKPEFRLIAKSRLQYGVSGKRRHVIDLRSEESAL